MREHRNVVGPAIAALLLVGGCVLPPRGEPPVVSTTTTTTAASAACANALDSEGAGDNDTAANAVPVILLPFSLTGTLCADALRPESSDDVDWFTIASIEDITVSCTASQGGVRVRVSTDAAGLDPLISLLCGVGSPNSFPIERTTATSLYFQVTVAGNGNIPGSEDVPDRYSIGLTSP